jgi:hypothetical protein
MQVFALRHASMRAFLTAPVAVVFALFVAGCKTAPPMVAENVPVDAKAPPDDGGSSRGSAGGMQHAEALEALRTFPTGTVQSADGLVRVALPAGARWRRVTFWGFDAYAGFRFGQDHHAVAGAMLLEPLKGEGERACIAAFDEWSKPYVEAFSLKMTGVVEAPLEVGGVPAVTRRLYAVGESPIGTVDYYSAYAVTRRSDDVCVVLGLAVPVREAGLRAKRALDHLADEAFRTLFVDAAVGRKKP